MIRSMLRPLLIASAMGVAALSAGGPARAQAQPPAGSAPASSPAAGATLSPSHVAAAKEVVIGSGLGRSINAIAPQFAAQVRQTFAATRPEIVKDLDEVLASLAPEIDREREDMVDATARVFAGRMNEADLTEVAKFFSSPVGKRYVETQPAMLDAMFVEMQAWSQRLSENIITRVRVEMRKRGHEI